MYSSMYNPNLVKPVNIYELQDKVEFLFNKFCNSTTNNSNISNFSGNNMINSNNLQSSNINAIVPTQPQQNNQFTVKTVNSYDEAYNSMIDYDGKLNLFADMTNNCIYVKSFNPNDGKAYITTYIQQSNTVNNNQSNNQQVTIQDLQNVLDTVNNFRQETTKEMSAMKQDVTAIKKEWGMTTDESASK